MIYKHFRTIFLVPLVFFAQIAHSASVYENAEDGLTDGWSITDNSPAGATVTNVFDASLGSNVIQLNGTGASTANTFLLGAFSGSSAWSNTTEHMLSFRMRTDSPYIINVRLDTVNGTRYIRYKDKDVSGNMIGNTIDIGLGSNTDNDTWFQFDRDLQAELNAGEPGNIINSVNGIQIRGHVFIDDIALSDTIGSGTGTGGGGSNNPPVANAGANVTVTVGNAQTLNASASSDSDGTIASYQWRIQGSSTVIATGATPTLSPALAQGTYTLELTVTDDDNDSDTDTVTLTVNAAAVSNTPPVANAGSNVTVTVGNAQTLNASGSSDSDGTIASYQWRIQGSSTVIATGATPTLSPALSQGSYTLELTVTDNDNDSDTDIVTLTVNASSTSSGTTTVYEDAQDGLINGWSITDNSPAGATVTNVFDASLGSNVIQLNGTGGSTANTFLLGAFSGSSAWSNTTEHMLSFRMRTDSPYIINVRLDTVNGTRYIRYKDRDVSGNMIGNTIDIGLGSNTDNGTWFQFDRDLQAELNAGEPGNIINSVNGIQIRGHVFIDDIALSDTIGSGTGTGGGSSNNPPVANAGANVTVTVGNAQTLNASASSDSDGTIASYEWRIQGSSTVIATGATPTLSPALAQGTYTLELTVTDDDNDSDTDTVTLTVNAATVSNVPPVANAGANVTVTVGNAQTLNASASSDSDGTIASYQWRIQGSSTVIATGATPTLSPALAQGSYTLELTVTDNDNDSDTDTVTLTVNASSTSSGTTTIYEDAQDGLINGWSITDNDPVGATVTNVFDAALGSNAIQLNGTGGSTANTFLIGAFSGSSIWNNTAEHVLSFRMRTDSRYIINVRLDTVNGTRYIRYKNTDVSSNMVGTTVDIGLGSNTDNDTWFQVTRDLQADLNAGEPGNIINAVNGIQIRGHVFIDDIALSDTIGSSGGGASSNNPPVANAGANVTVTVGNAQTLNASASSDSDGTIASYQWRIQGSSTVIATGATPTLSPALAQGSYTLELTVTDNDNDSDTDTVTLTVGADTPTTLSVHNNPYLQQNSFLQTTPFIGTNITIRDNEGSARVGNSLWIADDNTSTLWEMDLTTGQYLSSITSAQLMTSVELGGTALATLLHMSDLEAMAYDPIEDVLYAFNGNCCTAVPNISTAFKLIRQPDGSFAPSSFNELDPAYEFSGVAAVPTTGELWVGQNSIIYPYDYDTNSLGTGVQIDVLGKIYGMGFSEDASDLIVVTSANKRLFRIDWASNTLVQDYKIRIPDLLDARSVIVVDDEFVIGDGGGLASATDPLSLAVFRFDHLPGILPQSIVDSVTNGQVFTSAPVVSGVASDDTAVEKMYFYLRDNATTLYLQPDSTWGGAYAFVVDVDSPGSISSTFSWTPPTLSSGSYHIRYQAEDNHLLMQSTAPRIDFVFDDQTSPVADAGANVTVAVGDAQTLDASASSDANGTIGSYQWRIQGSTTVIATGATPTLSPALPQGTHTLELTVIDNDNNSDTDTVVLTVNTAASSGTTTLYEDSEDGLTTGWSITDNSPAGATVTNVFDATLGSNVIQLDGTGGSTANTFLIGAFSGSSIWNNTTEHMLSFRMRTSSPYIINVRLDTVNGTRYVRYKNTDVSGNMVGTTVDIGLGSDTVNGTWFQFIRDLQADLNAGEPGNTITAVNGVQIRGHVFIDDIQLSDTIGSGAVGTTALTPLAEIYSGVVDSNDGEIVNGLSNGTQLPLSLHLIGDMNGDGLTDWFLARNQNDVATGVMGDAYVIFGSAGSLPTSFDLDSIDGSNGFILEVSDSAYRQVLSPSNAGDFNNDGYEDLIIGNHLADTNGTDSGAAYLIFGSPLAYAPVQIDLHTLDGVNGFEINGMAANDEAGAWVAGGGDINNDGYDDVIISAKGSDTSASDAGSVSIVFGTSTSSQASLELTSLDGISGFHIVGESANDQLGNSAELLGDFNDDGYADVIVGAHNHDANTRTDSGAAYIVYGDATFPAILDTSTLMVNEGLKITGAQINDHLGNSVHAPGDVDGDGIDDVIVTTGTGTSYIIYGVSTAISLELDLQSVD